MTPAPSDASTSTMTAADTRLEGGVPCGSATAPQLRSTRDARTSHLCGRAVATDTVLAICALPLSSSKSSSSRRQRAGDLWAWTTWRPRSLEEP